jgi:hypothetical protein
MDGDGGFWLLFWIVFIVLVIPKWRHAVLPRLTPPLRDAVGKLRSTVVTNGVMGGARQDAAMTILRERFARGEIDRAEYETRRDVLMGNGPTDTWGRV